MGLFKLFLTRLADERHGSAEEYGGGDSGGGGAQTARKRAEYALIGNRLPDASRERTSEARERHGCASASPFSQRRVDAEGIEYDAQHDIEAQYSRRSQPRPVNQELTHGAERTAYEEGFEVGQNYIEHISTPRFLLQWRDRYRV